MNRNEKGQFASAESLEGKYLELHEEYESWVARHVENERTQKRLSSGVKAWLLWCQSKSLGPLKADKDDVWLYIDESVADYADTTITRRFSSVSKYYYYLINHPSYDYPYDNPTKDLSLPRDFDIKNLSEYVRVLDQEGKQDIIAPSADEVRKLFGHPPGERGFTKKRNELILKLFWQTALRSDELSRVKLSNTDLEEGEIEVRSSKLNRRDHPDLYHRKVWYLENLDYTMYRYLQAREEKAPDADYLLVGNDGGKLEPPTLSKVVRRAADEDHADIQEPLLSDEEGNVKQHLWTAHRLRHARISFLANETDMDLNFIRMMAGHAKVDTTLKYVETNWDAAKQSYFSALT